MPNLNETCNCGASVVACHTVQLHLKTWVSRGAFNPLGMCKYLWVCLFVCFFMLHNADPLCAFEVFIQYFSLCCFIVFNRPFPIQSTASLNDISYITITAILMQSRYNNWGQSLGVSTYLTVMLFFGMDICDVYCGIVFVNLISTIHWHAGLTC